MYMNKKHIGLSFCALLAAGAAQAGAPLKVALVETLSGPQASTGLLYRAAVKYELDRLNAAGGWNGAPIQVTEYDNQGGPAGASDKVKAAIAGGAQIIIRVRPRRCRARSRKMYANTICAMPARKCCSSTWGARRWN